MLSTVLARRRREQEKAASSAASTPAIGRILLRAMTCGTGPPARWSAYPPRLSAQRPGVNIRHYRSATRYAGRRAPGEVLSLKKTSVSLRHALGFIPDSRVRV